MTFALRSRLFILKADHIVHLNFLLLIACEPFHHAIDIFAALIAHSSRENSNLMLILHEFIQIPIN